ncbi:MAG TPA: peptidoglycan-binding protein, partial [Telluria sp.]
AAAARHLRCHEGRGGLYELRTLDRPAVIALREGQATSYGVLVSLDASSATLLANGRRQVVDTGELATRMDGRFTTLWRYPTGFREQLGPGDHGADVDLLASRLAAAGEAKPRPAGARFDAALQDALRAFQRRQQLSADGLAGPLTLMRLNQPGGANEPHLAAKKNGM